MKALLDSASRSRPGAPVWFAVAIVLVAANLRPAVVGVAPVLPEIQAGVGLSATAAGVLTALPVLCFGLLAPAAPLLARRFGIGHTLLGVLVVICLGFAVRSSGPTAALYAGMVLVGSAIAVGNVLLPGLIKRDFPHRTGSMTGLYSMAISAGGALAAGTTVPLARAAGLDWRGALGIWGLFALVAAVLWAPHVRRTDRGRGTRAARVRGIWRSPLAWQVTAFMGLQSLGFYSVSAWLPAIFVDRGFDAATAGWLLAFASIVGLSGSLAAPMLATRLPQQGGVALGCTAVTGLGLLGILLVPGAEVVSMALLGIGQGASLGVSLTLMAMRAPDAAHAAQLSGMAQCVGYIGAAAGPFAVGAVHDLTGTWTAPILLLLAALAAQATAGALAGRDRLVTSRARIGAAPAPIR